MTSYVPHTRLREAMDALSLESRYTDSQIDTLYGTGNSFREANTRWVGSSEINWVP